MPDQEGLVGGSNGLWQRYVDGGRINHAQWLRAVAEGSFVGTCRGTAVGARIGVECGQHLRPRPADDRGGGKFDYEAECHAGHRVVAPLGKLPGTGEREARAKAAAAREAKRAPNNRR